MPANKMPEMPDYIYSDPASIHTGILESEVEDYGRACYLAGIADARACVPEEYMKRESDSEVRRIAVEVHNYCRATTLTNLTALEQEAKK